MSTHEPKLPSLKGKSFEYWLDAYHLRVTFEEEDRLHWEYVEAPGEDKGKNATESIDRTAIRDDIVQFAWKEATGINIIDVWDLGRMVLHDNSVMPDGTRSSLNVPLKAVTA